MLMLFSSQIILCEDLHPVFSAVITLECQLCCLLKEQIMVSVVMQKRMAYGAKMDGQTISVCGFSPRSMQTMVNLHLTDPVA